MKRMTEPPSSNLADKWSEKVMGYGFTAVPNLLLMYRAQMHLTATDCIVLIAVDSFRWSEDNPYPSLKALSKRCGYSTRTLSRTITGLEGQGIINRIKRRGTSNEYDLCPLTEWMERLLERQVPMGQAKVGYAANDKSDTYQRTPLSPKEDPKNKGLNKKDKNNEAIEGEFFYGDFKPFKEDYRYKV
jgi:DNA-binding HxlR family transcriptional regulator